MFYKLIVFKNKRNLEYTIQVTIFQNNLRVRSPQRRCGASGDPREYHQRLCFTTEGRAQAIFREVTHSFTQGENPDSFPSATELLHDPVRRKGSTLS